MKCLCTLSTKKNKKQNLRNKRHSISENVQLYEGGWYNVKFFFFKRKQQQKVFMWHILFILLLKTLNFYVQLNSSPNNIVTNIGLHINTLQSIIKWILAIIETVMICHIFSIQFYFWCNNQYFVCWVEIFRGNQYFISGLGHCKQVLGLWVILRYKIRKTNSMMSDFRFVKFKMIVYKCRCKISINSNFIEH